ncbi:glycosyltransferase family protein [candidate division CSSED10-310 bacterium]|uniref:Glycosyltransferase family protein n=1 Tax=candidate division CSSED10-310 bacterium TaxID=2855610 RepID=A0ABV6Z1A8_UNCC1
MVDRVTIAYFISSHGYGHAARAAAIMVELKNLNPALAFEIFTAVPAWFFQESLVFPFQYHAIVTDIGLVQKTSLQEDLNETILRLSEFYPFNTDLIDDLVFRIHESKCRFIISDIAPLGLAVAQHIGLPSLLVENFTWDWIYQSYANAEGRLKQYASYLSDIFVTADYRIQTEPVCMSYDADLITAPVCRRIKQSALKIRQQLAIPKSKKMVTITMGGIPWKYTFLQKLTDHKHIQFIIPGAANKIQKQDNLILLPNRSGIFHPDLVNASDAVIGKTGYSTLAEVFHGGIPFMYVARPDFPESEILARFIQQQMYGIPLTELELNECSFLSQLPEILDLRRLKRNSMNGSVQAAEFIHSILQNMASQVD